RLRTSWSISAPPPIGRADHRDCTKGKKHRAKNVSIPRPGRDCAEYRQEGEQSEVARLGVHSRPRLKGAATRPRLHVCASSRPSPGLCATRRDGRPSFWERPSHALPDRGDPPWGDASRPSAVGGVNELVKYADIDVR